MENPAEFRLLKIYISNTDKFRHTLLSETIVFAARRYGLSGATVLKGIMGFGSSKVVQSSKFWEITEKIPVVIEIVDEREKIDNFVKMISPWLAKLRYGCLISSEKIDILFFKKGEKKGFLEI